MARRLVLSTASFAFSGVCRRRGSAMVARMPMTAMTMISSRRVKPSSTILRRDRLPLGIGHPVHPGPRRQRVDVVDVLAAPALGIRFVLVAAQAPFGLPRHRVEGDAT